MKTTGPLYKVADFSTRYLNVPPNMHRLRNAVGLLVGLYAGRKLMDIIAGETIDGKKIDREDVMLPLRPLHGIMAYDHFSDNPKDRWMKVFDMCVPAALGGMGAAMGSKSFFSKSFLEPVELKMGAPKGKFFLADAEREALYHQATPARLAAAHAAGYGSSSGFGIIPTGINYSSTLGTSFTLVSERMMVAPWMGKTMRAILFNNHSIEPLRPTKLIPKMVEQLAGNTAQMPKNFDDAANGVLKTWFPKIDPGKVDTFKRNLLRARDEMVRDAKLRGKTAEHLEAEVKANMGKLLNQTDHSFENRLIEAGIDPREAAIGEGGVVTTLTRWGGDMMGFKTTAKLKATQAKLIAGLEERHPELVGKAFTPARLDQSNTASKVLATALTGGGVATIAAIASAKDTSVQDLKHGLLKPHKKSLLADYNTPQADAPGPEKKEEKQPAPFADKVQRKHIVHSHKDHGFVNGKLLDTAEGVTGMFNAGVGAHRVHCAMGLTVGSWLGDKVMEAMTGRSFTGAHVPIDKVWKPLQKIYKVMPFNPQSDLPKDKWTQVLRWGIPGIVGTIAVVQGSKMFFEKRHEKLKKAESLDEVESRATMAQSKPWAATSAVIGLFGYPSGLPMLPLVNYSTNLGTRFSMGSGRKVSLPGLGKIWSNNSTLFPFGPPGMINMIIQEAVNNKAYDPEMLETYAIGVLKPWFDNVKPEQVEAFVQKVYEVRDKFYQEGGVPENLKAELEKELKAHFRGAGLEETLEEIGLDPLKASIGSNGLSGAIANMLGAKKDVEQIKHDYAESYRKRLHRRQEEAVDRGLIPR